jgi:hypothetical protein
MVSPTPPTVNQMVLPSLVLPCSDGFEVISLCQEHARGPHSRAQVRTAGQRARMLETNMQAFAPSRECIPCILQSLMVMIDDVVSKKEIE